MVEIENLNNNEISLAIDHIPLNSVHEHSSGVSDTDPHSHNSQESVASIMLQNGQFLVVYESYHGDSEISGIASNSGGLVGLKENNRDSIYYKIYNYSNNNLVLLNNFNNLNGYPYKWDAITEIGRYKKQKTISYTKSDGTTASENKEYIVVDFKNGIPVKKGTGDEEIMIGEVINNIEKISTGLLVNKTTYYNQRDPSVCTLGSNHFIIAWQSNHFTTNSSPARYSASSKYGIFFNVYSNNNNSGSANNHGYPIPIIHELAISDTIKPIDHDPATNGAGTISVNSATPTIINGTNTNFTNHIKAGDYIKYPSNPGQKRLVVSVDNDSQITVDRAFTDFTVNGNLFTITDGNARNYKYYSVNNHNFYSNLFVKVEELENNCFLAVWRYREFTHEVEGTQYKTRIETVGSNNIIHCKVKGRIIRLKNANGSTINDIVEMSPIFDISDDDKPPCDFDYETGLISLSKYKSGKIAVTWLGYNYNKIYTQILNYNPIINTVSSFTGLYENTNVEMNGSVALSTSNIITTDTVSANTKFNIGDTVYRFNSGNYQEIGVIQSLTTNQITFYDNILHSLYDDEKLYSAKKLGNNVTINSLTENIISNNINLNLYNRPQIILNNNNYLLTWGAGYLKDVNLPTPITKNTYGKLIDHNYSKILPINSNNEVINSSSFKLYNNVIHAFTDIIDNKIISCYALSNWFTGNTTQNSTIITNITTTNLKVGDAIVGDGIDDGTTISSISLAGANNNGTIVISKAVTSTNSNATLSNDNHKLSKTSDIYCNIISAVDFKNIKNFRVNNYRKYLDNSENVLVSSYKQSNPIITRLKNNDFIVQWESFNALEPVIETTNNTPSSDDDLFYKILKIKELASGIFGDPYLVTLNGDFYKLANFEGFFRLLQGTYNYKLLTINCATKLEDNNEAFMTHIYINYGDEYMLFDMNNLIIIKNNSNFEIKNKIIESSNIFNHDIANWHYKNENESKIINVYGIKIIISKYKNPQIKTGVYIENSF